MILYMRMITTSLSYTTGTNHEPPAQFAIRQVWVIVVLAVGKKCVCVCGGGGGGAERGEGAAEKWRI